MNMKKLLIIITALAMSLLLTGVCSAAANNSDSSNGSSGSNGKDRVAILLMGSNDFKSTQYFTMIENHFLKDNPHASQIALGADVQSKYQEYWLDKGFLEEQQPTKDDLLAMPAYLGVDKVLVMIVKDPVVEKHWAFTLMESGEKSRASIQINAFLVNNDKILKSKVSNNEDDSFSSDLRAKRGAFKKCMKEISVEMLPLF